MKIKPIILKRANWLIGTDGMSVYKYGRHPFCCGGFVSQQFKLTTPKVILYVSRHRIKDSVPVMIMKEKFFAWINGTPRITHDAVQRLAKRRELLDKKLWIRMEAA